MADSLVAALFENAGLDADEILQSPAPFVPPDLSDVATRHHLALLDRLHAVKCCVERMMWAVASEPGHDDQFDKIDVELGTLLAAAGDDLRRFRNIRDCLGEA
jgi:hypothetical protein